jgi:hypothetical protein
LLTATASAAGSSTDVACGSLLKDTSGFVALTDSTDLFGVPNVAAVEATFIGQLSLSASSTCAGSVILSFLKFEGGDSCFNCHSFSTRGAADDHWPFVWPF